MKNAKSSLEKKYKADMNYADAVELAIATLKEGYEGKKLQN